ncbi:hypothetical protein LR48_Vigan492s001200 [Vigna angularis]|uniref:Putative plant transposon protein domain-containing protein n=1 Tax=Phaseolus angularis TaxID=3914 RepID=A0A0L9TBX3_PHAAN|nr:hypothetical protein LR48_Vigan492s001200 [Vigna angularis]
MADSRRHRRRTAGASSSSQPRLANIDGWISDQGKHADFVNSWQERKIMAVKFIRLDFFRFYGFQFPNTFAEQGLTHLLEQKGCIYPDLIRVFYFNLRYRDGIISTKVKGVRMILDDDIWTNVAQLPIWDDAVKVHLGLEDFNRMMTFQSFLRHPERQTNRRQLLVGGFKVEERMIHYLIVWILCPRATNHAQCSEQDLLLLYGILNHIHIDWPALIADTMVKAKKSHSYQLPYALLISRILEFKGVSVEGELVQNIETVGTEIGDTTFHQMGFITRGRVLIHKDDDHPDVDEDDDMDTHMADPVSAAAPSDAGPSNIPSSSSTSMEEHFARLSKQLEDMSLAQKTHFEEIYEWQRSVDEYMVDQFLDLDVRLSNIENHLNIQPPERSPSPEF